jgi:hypothetical protein
MDPYAIFALLLPIGVIAAFVLIVKQITTGGGRRRRLSKSIEQSSYGQSAQSLWAEMKAEAEAERNPLYRSHLALTSTPSGLESLFDFYTNNAVVQRHLSAAGVDSVHLSVQRRMDVQGVRVAGLAEGDVVYVSLVDAYPATIVHELAHVAVNGMDGDRGHGVEWHRMYATFMEAIYGPKVGRAFGRNLLPA